MQDRYPKGDKRTPELQRNWLHGKHSQGLIERRDDPHIWLCGNPATLPVTLCGTLWRVWWPVVLAGCDLLFAPGFMSHQWPNQRFPQITQDGKPKEYNSTRRQTQNNQERSDHTCRRPLNPMAMPPVLSWQNAKLGRAQATATSRDQRGLSANESREARHRRQRFALMELDLSGCVYILYHKIWMYPVNFNSVSVMPVPILRL